MRKVAVLTTGFFDGVHLGHRHVISTVVSAARERGEEAIVVTFWPHPRTVLQQDARDFRLLTSLEEKKELLLAAGVDRVEVLPFTREFAAMKADEYLHMLRDRFGATLVVMGYDNRIGSDRKLAEEICILQTVACATLPKGDPSSYTAEDGHGFAKHKLLLPEVSIVKEIVIPSEKTVIPSEASVSHISSTQIRKALAEGNIASANAMLGYSYGLYGVVVAGNRMGRTIGFPTANMQLYEPLKLVPCNGVYAVEVEVLGRSYRGMCNIGMRPTVGGTGRTIETHILNFDEDIYGLPLRIRFLRRIRDERRFPSLEALREQLLKDKLSAAN